MKVFISHSSKDKDQFENIADALNQRNVPYWQPSDIEPGSLLSEQLRARIANSVLCLFIATKNSIKSAWCGAEVGAFWGAGKPVLIFVADSSLTDQSLPPQFKGQFVERKIAKLADAASRYFVEDQRASAQQRQGAEQQINRPQEVIETSERSTVWEFSDSPTTGMLNMAFTTEYNRKNPSSIPILGMKPGGFELYLWSVKYSIEEVCCAQSQEAFYGSGELPIHKLPFVQNGPTFEIDTKNPNHSHAMLAPGESTWFRWKGSVEVPQTYWDVLVGTTETVGKESFTIKNHVQNTDIVFMLKPSGKSRNYDTNLHDKNKRYLELPISVEKSSWIRGTVSWCPLGMITNKDLVMKYIKGKYY